MSAGSPSTLRRPRARTTSPPCGTLSSTKTPPAWSVEAAEEFQKILSHKGANWGSTWRSPNWGQYYSIAYLGLARASVLAGDVPNARKAFETFFVVWKDADPDIAILQQARAEYRQAAMNRQQQGTRKANPVPLGTAGAPCEVKTTVSSRWSTSRS